MIDFRIRVLLEADKEACVAITKENWPDEQRVRNHINYELNDPDQYLLVADHGGIILGWAGWCWSKISYDIAEFTWCNVKPEYQNKGVGRELTKCRIKAVQALEGKAIILTTGKPHIYARYGFQTIDVLPLWIGPSTHLMSLELHND